jgi:xylan 1,4-beta-xylosidase
MSSGVWTYSTSERWLPILVTVAAVIVAGETPNVSSAAGAFPASIHVDAGISKGPMRPIWRFFGADEPNYAYMRDGRRLLSELGQLAPRRVYFRTHNLLTSGDGTPALKWGSTNAYREDAQGRPVYDWTIVDRIFDTYLERGVRPYVQIGFMPQDLSTRPSPYQHSWTPMAKYDEIFTGWAHPPKDYGRWRDLVHAWVAHSVERYGRAEVEGWYWQVWNEANIGYWQGTPEEFHKLHDYAIEGVRRTLPTARVGGPDTAGHGGPFMRAFLEHVLRGTNYATGRIGTPLDFVSFHAKGRPSFVDGHVRMGIADQLATIDEGFRVITSHPELKPLPIVIGESDPDGCAACQGPQLGYRNTTMYSSYTAASMARLHDLADRHGANLEGALTWAFEFEDQPYFAGFRALASNGVALPVLNVFRAFSRMGGNRVAVTSDAAAPLDAIVKTGVRDSPDVAALASRDGSTVSILVWHYHDDDVPGPEAEVQLTVAGLPVRQADARLTHFRIDAEHSNAHTAWLRMGSPQTLTGSQRAELEKAGQLQAMAASARLAVLDSRSTMTFTLPRQAVSLLVIEM